MYPTPEQIRAAVQAQLNGDPAATPLIAVVTEASHGNGGPVYAVAFAPAGVAEAMAVPA